MQQSKVTTAVILASGFGGRRMPVVSVIQKEMIPILNRPTIDYVVADCVKAGIKRIIFVVRPDITQIKDYYTHPVFLPDEYKDILFEFTERYESHGVGTASALTAALHLLADEEAFVVCAGDGFLYGELPSYVGDLLHHFESSKNAQVGLLTTKCKASKLHRYGVLSPDHAPLIVEKPTESEAPSNKINVSQYVFTKDFIPYLTDLEPVSGEYRLTDAVNAFVADGAKVVIREVAGPYYDAGDLAGWLEANRRLDPLENPKVLVIGGDGFIGKHVVRVGWDVIDLKRGSDIRQGIKGQYSCIVFLACDIAQTDEAYAYNEEMYEALDAYMLDYPDTHVIFASSAAVYSDSTIFQTERQVLSPPTIYGKSKLLGEVYAQQYRRHTILRFSNVYGAGEGNGVIDQFIRGAKPVGDPNCVRDYVPVETVARCIHEAVKYPDDWHGVTNISSGTGMTVRQVWEMVKGDEPFTSTATRVDDVSYSVLDNTRMKQRLGEA